MRFGVEQQGQVRLRAEVGKPRRDCGGSRETVDGAAARAQTGDGAGRRDGRREERGGGNWSSEPACLWKRWQSGAWRVWGGAVEKACGRRLEGWRAMTSGWAFWCHTTLTRTLLGLQLRQHGPLSARAGSATLEAGRGIACGSEEKRDGRRGGEAERPRTW